LSYKSYLKDLKVFGSGEGSSSLELYQPIHNFDSVGKRELEGVGVRHSLDTHYLDQGSLKVRETWIKALKYAEFDKDRLVKVKDCNREGVFLTYQCPSDKHSLHRLTRPYDPCNDSFCLYDSGRYGRKKGIDVYRKLNSIPTNFYGHYVFTTPKKYWDVLFTHKNANRLKKVTRETLVEFYGFLQEQFHIVKDKEGVEQEVYFFNVGGIHRPHVWGDKKPEYIGRREVHVHVLIPLLGFDKDKKIVHLKKFLSGSNLNYLRRVYKRRFCAEFGVSFDGEIVVNYSYKDKKRPETLMNCCQYIARPPLELPLRKGIGKAAHFGVERLMEIVEKFRFYDGYRSLTWFGWMSNGVVRKKLELLKMSDREVSRFFKKHEKGTCPICGLKMELVAVYYNNKLVMWKGKDPPNDEKEFDGIARMLFASGGSVGWMFKGLKGRNSKKY